MNAALQALCTTPLLKMYFEMGYEQWEANEHNKQGYQGRLVARFRQLIKQLYNDGGSFAPTQLRQVLAMKNSDLCREGEQQDSVELLQVLLDGLHEDLNRVKEHKQNKDIPDSAGRPDAIVSQEHWDLYKRQNNSLIVDLFNLQLKSSIQCQKCNFTSSRFQTELCLHLPVPTDEQFVATVLIYDQLKSSLHECRISLPNKGTFGDLKAKIEPARGPMIFATDYRQCRDTDLVKEFIPLNVTAYAKEPKAKTLFVGHRKVNIRKTVHFRKERFAYFGRPICLQFDALDEVFPLLDSALGRLLKSGHSTRKTNSATDCDDLMADSVPYRILLVRSANHAVCATCPWEKLCTGCEMNESMLELLDDDDKQLLVHWETVALHFKYREPERTPCKELQDAGKDFNVINCLKMLEQSEKLEEWKCEKCDDKQTAMKQLMPYRFPPILVIHLKRFELNMLNMRWMKCSRHIKAQTELEISDGYRGETLQYRLYAAIIHQGSLDGGHYTALCRRQSKWVLFNDDHVTCVEPDATAEYLNNAYVLFYERPCDFEGEIKPAIDPAQFRDMDQILHPNQPKDKKHSACVIQ